ncbi:MAG: DegT/DnrJ/EryC1/StrS family aminotransferase [Burkholderiaceae bacterium]
MAAPSVSVPLLVPDLPDRDELWPYLRRIDESRHYSNFGPLVHELEQRFTACFNERSGGAPVALTSVSSCTLGLELALGALQLPPRSKVLVPALTFVATATAVLRAGHLPVVADVDERSWALTPEIAARALREADCRAVLPVATFGQPVPLPEWHRFEQASGVPVLVDAAGAFGSQWLDAGGTLVFSLHATKALSSGEGGLVVSTDAELIRRVRQMSNFGINLDAGAAVPVGVSHLAGTNAKMSEYHAAVGLAAFDRWPRRAPLRRERWLAQRARLDEAADGQLIWQGGEAPAAPVLMSLRWSGAGRRDALERHCARLGVVTRRWYQPLLPRHALAPGMLQRLATPVADMLAEDLVGVPFFPDLECRQLDTIAQAVRLTVDEFRTLPA